MKIQPTKQQKDSIKAIDSVNALLLKSTNAVMVLSNDNKPFAVILGKPNEYDFIPAIIQAINEEKDCTCEIESADIFDYGYMLELKVAITVDNETYTETLEGVYSITY
jgi:hypothetical protein